MNKYWEQTSNKTYKLFINGNQVVTLEKTARQQATIHTRGRKFRIVRKKSWSRSFQILDEQDEVVAQVAPRKWYAETLVLQYQGQEYLLKHRNNPLFETVMQDLQKKDIIAYGKGVENLKEKITVTDHRQLYTVSDYLPDAIVWFLFQSVPDLDPLDFI